MNTYALPAAILVLAVTLLTGCSLSEEGRITSHCKELITKSLVSPSTAKFVDSVTYRRVVSDYRMPDGFEDTEKFIRRGREVARDLESVNRQMRLSPGDVSLMQRSNALETEAAQIRADIARFESGAEAVRKLPWGEIHWELDSQNRSGAMLRSVGVCTWKDDGSDWKESIRLSKFGEGRLPTVPPRAFEG